MSNQRTPTAPTKLDQAIETLLTQMASYECDSNEYAKMADQLVKLYKAREIDTNFKLKEIDSLVKQDEADAVIRLKKTEIELKKKEVETSGRVSKDTVALIAANLAGIVLVLGYERFNVITSKAFGFVSKLR